LIKGDVFLYPSDDVSVVHASDGKVDSLAPAMLAIGTAANAAFNAGDR